MKKSWEQIHQELSEPFSHEDVEWKIQTVSKDLSLIHISEPTRPY